MKLKVGDIVTVDGVVGHRRIIDVVETKVYISNADEPYCINCSYRLNGGGDKLFFEDNLNLVESTDTINHPNHYKGRNGLEAIEVVRNFGNDDMISGFYWGNAVKYLTRYRNKNGVEDLKKARKNLNWLIEHEEEKE